MPFQIFRYHVVSATWIAIACLAFAGCSEKKDWVAVQPVQGKLVVNNRPAAGAMVVFHPIQQEDARAIPRGTVGEDGAFKLSTYETDDGAPLGKFKVTIDWRKGATIDKDGVSLVPLKYTKPDRTPLEVDITPETRQLDTFEIVK